MPKTESAVAYYCHADHDMLVRGVVFRKCSLVHLDRSESLCSAFCDVWIPSDQVEIVQIGLKDI